MAAPEPAPTAAPVAVPQPASARPSIDIASMGVSNFFMTRSSLAYTRCKGRTSDGRACLALVPFRGEGAHAGASLPHDSVLLELAPERRAADAERLRGTRVVATEALERRQDVRTLRFGERDLPRQRRRRTELQAGRHVRRQIIGLDGLAAAQDGGALDRILQLPDVAGPRIAQHAFQRGRREPQRAAQLRRRAREEVLGQRRNVLAAIAQRRQGHLDHVETVEDILAEAPLADPPREI